VIETLNQSNLLTYNEDHLAQLGFSSMPILNPFQKYKTKFPGIGIHELNEENGIANQRRFRFGNEKGIKIQEFFEGFRTTYLVNKWLQVAKNLKDAPDNVSLELANIGQQTIDLARGWDRTRAEFVTEVFANYSYGTPDAIYLCPQDAQPIFSTTHSIPLEDGTNKVFSNISPNSTAYYTAYDAATTEADRLTAIGAARVALTDDIRAFEQFTLANGQKLPFAGTYKLFTSRYRRSFWDAVLRFGTPQVFKGAADNLYDTM
jgi:hypothetical protein